MGCDVECLSTYAVLPAKDATEGAVFAPFVELNLKGNFFYTVGNDSSESDGDKTAIKSFQYGFGVASAGVGGKIELVSEGGSAYIEFAKNLNKTISNAVEDTKNTWFKFGWIVKTCDGHNERIESPEINIMIKTMQTSYETGTVKISLEFIDLMSRHFERTIEGNFGSDDNKIPLKEAIHSVFENNDPEIKVEFLDADGKEWCFKYGGCEGPRGKWPGEQQNALAVIRKWLAGQVTDNDKGTIVQYNVAESSLVIKEDPGVGANESDACSLNSIATYVVNGGNCSDVISFTPTVDWILFNHAGGGTSPSGDAGVGDETADPDIDIEHAGPRDTTTIQAQDRDSGSPNNSARRNQESSAAQTRANKDYEIKPGIEAELKILGDPKGNEASDYSNPLNLAGKTISIVVINPYHIEDCQWISEPKCNEVLSNKNWLILGIDHQISEGQFFTTIKVKLYASNMDIAQGEPLGGAGCGTLAFDNDEGEVEKSI